MSKDTDTPGKPWLSPGEVAARMKVSPITVRGWSNNGLLAAETTPGGHRRYRREVVEQFARTWNPAGNQGPLRVLIVDDDATLVGFLRELLGDRDSQTEIDSAQDGFDAGQKILTFQP